jgi:NAD(P)-dependent dehydrogenase (short-subunit alcohol dehydrogenase family)
MSAFDTISHFRLDGRVALVTGASRGLGLAIAESLAGAGADLVITGRHEDTLHDVAQSIREKTQRKVLSVVMDVGQIDDSRRTVDLAMQTFGKIDVLVNNAGVNQRLPALEYSEEAWDAVTDVNLKGAFFLAQACGQVMVPRRQGKIINILSLTTAWGLPTVVAYTAAKTGLAGLTRMLAVEWGAHNIQVNGIAPGFFRTELTKPVQQDIRNDWILHRTPLGRWGEPEELTGATIFLASAASDYVTGHVLWVDGGMTVGSDWRTGL